MSSFFKIALAATAFLFCSQVFAQNQADVFVPISKYISRGEAEPLSAWFDDCLDITVSSDGRNASKTQARQILKAFFDQNTPSDFKITHTATQGDMKSALGTLVAGGKNFSVTIFVIYKNNQYKIQQLKIEG